MPQDDSPRMNTNPQITRADPVIRIPACLSVSPKKARTRPEYTRPIVRPANRPISPSEASQSRGTASQPGTRSPGRDRWISSPLRTFSTHRLWSVRSSLDHVQLGVGCKQGLGEDVVEGEPPQEGDHHRLVDGPPDPGGASGRIHPLVGAD